MTRIPAALAVAKRVYGGIRHSPTDTDADKLAAIADWLDEIDDITDAGFAEIGSNHRVRRTVQADLRRIAGTLR